MLELKLKRLEQTDSEAVAKPTPTAKPETPADEASSFDWRNVPNAELKGDHRHDAYAEKLCRSVEAI